jgi:hypothetical protein
MNIGMVMVNPNQTTGMKQHLAFFSAENHLTVAEVMMKSLDFVLRDNK